MGLYPTRHSLSFFGEEELEVTQRRVAQFLPLSRLGDELEWIFMQFGEGDEEDEKGDRSKKKKKRKNDQSVSRFRNRPESPFLRRSPI